MDLPFVHVTDKAVADAVAFAIPDQRPEILGVFGPEAMLRREHRTELPNEHPLVQKAGEDRSKSAAEQPLPCRGQGPLEHDAPVEQQGSTHIHRQPTLKVARHQLGCH